MVMLSVGFGRGDVCVVCGGVMLWGMGVRGDVWV